MMIRRTIWRLAFMVAIAGLAVGCGGSGGLSVPTEPVTGKVTLNGAPVAGAIVAFSPKADGVSAAFGTTDATGSFALTTVQPGDGAMVGSYGVSISKTSAPAGAAASAGEYVPDDPASMDAAYRDHAASQTGADEPQDLLPAKYKDANTSGFDAEVTSDGDNSFTFDMKN